MLYIFLLQSERVAGMRIVQEALMTGGEHPDFAAAINPTAGIQTLTSFLQQQVCCARILSVVRSVESAACCSWPIFVAKSSRAPVSQCRHDPPASIPVVPGTARIVGKYMLDSNAPGAGHVQAAGVLLQTVFEFSYMCYVCGLMSYHAYS
jgi:hypothetical protein